MCDVILTEEDCEDMLLELDTSMTLVENLYDQLAKLPIQRKHPTFEAHDPLGGVNLETAEEHRIMKVQWIPNRRRHE